MKSLSHKKRENTLFHLEKKGMTELNKMLSIQLLFLSEKTKVRIDAKTFKIHLIQKDFLLSSLVQLVMFPEADFFNFSGVYFALTFIM